MAVSLQQSSLGPQSSVICNDMIVCLPRRLQEGRIDRSMVRGVHGVEKALNKYRLRVGTQSHFQSLDTST